MARQKWGQVIYLSSIDSKKMIGYQDEVKSKRKW
jgi:hypothetical protein